jgi:hypothetical protein
MTRDQIINFVHEAGIIPPGWGATENQWRSLHKFAELVAEYEREMCVKICEDQMEWGEINPTIAIAAGNCADLISARGDK